LARSIRRKAHSRKPAATAAAVRRALRAQARPERVAGAQRFFKCGPGEYGEGDRFLSVTVPAQRRIARAFRDLPLDQADSLLTSPIHEERLTALFILVDQFERTDDDGVRGRIFRLYLNRLRFINNWDLVDSSAPQIVGGWLADKPRPSTGLRAVPSGVEGRNLLDRLARSPHLWSRRIAMLATFHFIYRGEHRDAIRIARLLVHDGHDLIHKAVGWMLREVGKRASPEALSAFLEGHAATMPRTMLRYAIERLPARDRQRWMNMAGQRQERNKIRPS
jgi:3-methyladenine DNA glycosylase AlkD